MNILHIIPTLRKGGAERIVLDTCIELQKHSDVRVKLVTLYPICEYPDLSEKVDWQIVPSRYVPSITGRSLCDVTQLEELFASFQPDIIHTHLWEAEMVARQVGYTRGRWFSHFHDNMRQLSRLTWPLSKQKITDAYERHIMLGEYKKRDSHFVAISKHCEAYARKNLPRRYIRAIHLLNNAIDVSRFRRSSTAIQDTQLKLVSVGSLLKNKNHVFLIDIISYLTKLNIDVQLTVVGEGVERMAIEKAVSLNRVSDKVLLIGRNDFPEQTLWQSSIYVHASLSEAFGLTLLEAMAAGLPVVTLNGGGNVDIMKNGGNGFIINQPDPALFAEKILEIWQNKQLYAEMSEYARNFAQQFDIKEYVVRLLTLYRA